MTQPWMYGFDAGDYPTVQTARSSSIPVHGQPSLRRSSYASVVSSGVESWFRPARPGSVLNILNPSSDEADDSMSRGNSYFDRNSMAGTGFGGSLYHEAGGGVPLWQQKTSSLPWHSRAFDPFLTRDSLLPDDFDSNSNTHNSDFLAPSYLRGMAYLEKLEEQHKRRILALRDGQHSIQARGGGGGGGLTSTGSSLSLSHSGKLAPPSHRGMTLDVVEKPPKFDVGEATVKPLPSRWDAADKHPGLDVLGEGYDVKFTGPKAATENSQEAYAIRADHPMPSQCGVYYFEITVLARKQSVDQATTIAIGFSSRTVSLNRAPGWEPESWAYHGDDGNSFAGQSVGKSYGPKFGHGDTVGCLVNFRTGTVIFTKNGDEKGIAFRDASIRDGKKEYYPTIGLKRPGDHVTANFGQLPFVYAIDGYVKMEKEKIWEKIRQSDTTHLVPGMSGTELIQQLVLQHLQHDGYVETARAFAEEIVAEKKRLQLDPNEPVPGINIKDDEDARKRQQIRRAILEGNIDQALKFTNTYYPKVLRVHPQVYFRLRCRKFIEMIRKDAEENLRRDNTSNRDVEGARSGIKGVQQHHHFEDEEMEEVDEGGEWGEPMEDDQPTPYSPPAVGKLLQEALEYGQELRAEFSNLPDPEMSKQLDEIFALIAYSNPLKEETVAHLLDRSGRVAVAEELNSAILRKSSRSALETMYAQTVVLLEELGEDGGDGTFVSTRDIMDRIPDPKIRP